MTTGCGCGSNGGETLIFTCAGAAHSGQAANRAGVQAMQQGIGNLFCIAAVAADIPDKMTRVRKAGKRIAIDGCSDHCCRKVLEKAGLTADVHVVATELGIEKKPAQPDMAGDASKIVDKIKALAGPAC
ncbi:MAG: putative zinc-binding protein [Phycisphaerae bacterium]|nr:putative zinc-binding protein [Phycisphaerae bacterium]